MSLVKFRAANFVTLPGGVLEEDVLVKQDDACCNRVMGVTEEDVY